MDRVTPLEAGQLAKYAEQGFLVVEDLLTPEFVAEFLEHHNRPRPEAWQLGLRTHTVDPLWRRIANWPPVLDIVEQLLAGPARIVQTMFLDKPPGGGLGIALHQDALYLPNDPPTLMACWLALADTGADNGGLCVVPGSHTAGLRSAHQSENTAEHASWTKEHLMRDREGREWTETIVSFEMDQLDPESIVRLRVPAGGGVFFTGTTIHGSFANHSSARRRPAFATHYVRDGTWLLRCDVQDTVPVER